MERVTFAVRTLAAFGIRDLLLTNAAGSINKKFRAGDFMVLTDHINFIGVNPLRPGGGDAWRRRTFCYGGVSATTAICGSDRGLRQNVARTIVPRRENYQTEIAARCLSGRRAGRATRRRGDTARSPRIGADAVGMSTVPEAIVGAAMRLARGGGFVHHQSGGGHRREKTVARGGSGNSGAGEKNRRGAAETVCGALREIQPGMNTAER